jgi:tight adherence protein C
MRPNIFLQRISKRSDLDHAGLPGRARPAADLRRGRHVDRGAIQKVSQEIGGSSIELAEELSLLSAELSYLPERRHGL